MPHEDQSLLTAAGALHALDEEEAQALEAHIEECATCTVEMMGFRETAARLGAAVAQAAPSTMRQAVLDRIAVTRQLPPQVEREHRHEVPVTASPVEAAAQATDATLPSVGSLSDARDRRNRRNWLLAAAAAVVVLLGVGTTVLVNRGSESADPLRQCLSSASDQRSFPATANSVGTTVTTVSSSCGAAKVDLSNLPPLPDGRTYQLWVIAGQQARSVGVYGTQTVSDVVTPVHLGDTAIGLTVEPGGGSAAPTTTPVVLVPLT